MDQKNFLSQALSLIKRQRRQRRWLQAVTGMAAVVVFITAYLLILPAITMEHGSIQVETGKSDGVPGEPITANIYAEAADDRTETVFVLAADGNNAGLDEQQIGFDQHNTAQILDDAGQEIILHREFQKNGAIHYWFILGQGQASRFSLPWVNGVDRCHTVEAPEDASYQEPHPLESEASASLEEPALSYTQNSTELEENHDFPPENASNSPDTTPEEDVLTLNGDSAAQPSTEGKEQEDPEARPAGDGLDDADSAASQPESSRCTELVCDEAGDPERAGSLRLSFGSGETLHQAEQQAQETVALTWTPALEEISEEEIPEEEIPLGEAQEEASSWVTVEKVRSAPNGGSAVMRFPAAVNAAGLNRASEWYDFTEDITNVTVSVKENGNWVPSTELTDGDSVQVEIKFQLPANTVDKDNKKICYQLPSGVSLAQEESGIAYQDGVAVGSYTIGTDGRIEIVFNDEFADSSAFNGTILFEGTVSVKGDGTNNELDFGAGGIITVRPNSNPNDVSVEKSGEYSKDDGKLHYQLTVSTQNGTGGPIKVNDNFSSGDTRATYDEDSFQIVKVDQNGHETVMQGYKPVISSDNWEGAPQRFEIAGLPELAAGESYRIDYTATPEKSSHANGYSAVNNWVTATVEGGSGSDSAGVVIYNNMLQKSGSYDAATNTIRWTITVNPDGRDISGYTISDTITANGVTANLPDTVTLTDSKGGSVSVSLPHTFPKGSSDTYTITYETVVEGAGPGVSGSVNNKVELTEDDDHFGTDTTVSTQNRDYDFSKSFDRHDANEDTGSQGTYQWTAVIKAPNGAEVEVEKLTYTDTLSQLDCGNGPVPDSHYITGYQLQMLTASVDGIILEPGRDYIILDPQGNEIVNPDHNARYSGFQLKFSQAVADGLANRQIDLRYQSTVDYTRLEPGETYIIRNTGAIPGHTDDAETTYRKPQKFEKQASINAGYGYTYDSLRVDFTASQGVIHYRLLLRTDETTTGELTITDLLPSGAALVDGSVRLRFFWNDYYESDSITTEQGQYIGAEHIHTTVSPSNEDGTTPVTFTIDDGYNGDGTYHTLVVYYDISIAEDDRWTTNPGLQEHLYTNHAVWGDSEAETDVTVEREVSDLEKTGWQLPQYDQNGKPLTNPDGSPVLSNTVRYYVTINPGAKDLAPNQDTLTLEDTLTLPQAAVGAEFIVGSVHLYQYDEESENGCGAEMNPARYSYTYDSAAHKLTFTVPDSTAMVLSYEYSIDRGTVSGDLDISNSAQLKGVTDSKTENKTEFVETSSSVTVFRRTLTIYKVDGSNYGSGLAGAQFKLERYDSGSGIWSDVDAFTTDEDGRIVLAQESGDGTAVFEPDTLYRFTETQAPEGYAKDDMNYYFVWTGDGEDESTCKTNMGPILQAAGVQPDRVRFIVRTAAIYVPNEPTALTVRKLWTDEDGGEIMAGADSVEVKLWQHTAKLNAKRVTVITQGNGFTSPNDWNAPQTMYLDVAEGSGLTIQINEVWAEFLQIQIGESEFASFKADNQKVTCTLPPVTEDITVTVKPPEEKLNRFDKITFSQYTAPYYVPFGEPVLYETVTLTADNGWAYTWEGLPKTSESGDPYSYTVEETPVPGCEAIYSPNNSSGVQTGELTVTNRSTGFMLVETGGPGTFLFTIGGLALMALAGLVYMILRREEADVP